MSSLRAIVVLRAKGAAEIVDVATSENYRPSCSKAREGEPNFV
jgi:hypothetical protein